MKRTLQVFFLLLFVFQSGYSQERNITGTVTDASGLPLPGVNVSVKNTNRGAQTDFDGNYAINAAPNEVLVFTFVGLTRVERSVGNSTQINVSMQEDSEALDEVVVVGYGVQTKREITGSISQVKGDEIAGLITPSFESQLAGRAAGVQVTTQSGIIGETPRFRIRGIGSITSGTYPLVVVDGMPIYTGDIGGSASTNALGDINPTDIASIEILKDGSASAIYGSRAANGVVLITTKKGKEGRVAVNFNSSVAIASPIETFDLLKSADFVTISNEKRSNRGASPWAAGTDVETDWQDAVLNDNAFQQDQNLSISGGTERTNFYLSLGYTTQESVARPNEMTRYSYRSNIDQKINDWLSVGVNLGITQTENDGLNTGTNSLSGNIFNATRQHPNVPIFDADHPTGYNIDIAVPEVVGRGTNLATIGDNLPNIRFVIDNNRFTSEISRVIGNAYADIKPISSINFRTQISIDQAITNGFLYQNALHGDGRGANGRVSNNNTELVRWNWQNVLSYNEKFNDHSIGVTLINEFQKQQNKNFFGTGTDLSDSFFNKHLISNSFGVQSSGGSFSENGFVSYAARVNYNYANKYFIQGSIRRDGLSSLSPATRFGTFPGVSAGWTISNESFMEGTEDVISDLKLRGSYGKVGNSSIGNFPYLGLYGAARYGDFNGIGFIQFGNEDLRWETSFKTDIGLDMRLFRNRFTFSFDYFINETEDLILDRETPMSLGIPGNSFNANIGDIENSGYEFSAEARIFQGQDFQWTLNANISFIDNEVISLENGQDILFTNNITREGESINSLYGFRYWGVNPANGNPVYFKADGSLVQGMLPGGSFTTFDPANPATAGTASSLSSAADRTILGQTLPKYFGGLSSSMAYKNFDFGFLFRFSGGNKIFNATRRDLLNQNFTNNSTEILGRWQSVENPGDGWTPRLYWGTNTTTNLSSSATTRFVEDGDFIKLDNVTLGYTLPGTVTDKIGLNKFRVYVQGQNLLVITDYTGLDPEMEAAGVDLNGTPISSIFSLGLNIGL